MSKDFEVMGLMIYFGFIHLVDGGYSDLKAFEQDKNLIKIFDKFNDLEVYKHVQVPKLASRSFLALRGCYRKKKLDTDEVYKKLALVAHKITKEHLEYCINSTITLYYPDKKVPKNAFEEIVYINEKLGMDINFTYKHLALEDLTAIDKAKERARMRSKIDEESKPSKTRSVRDIVILMVILLIVLTVVFLVIK